MSKLRPFPIFSKNLLVFLIFLANPQPIFSQSEREMDSLRQVLDTAKTSQIIAATWFQIGSKLRKNHPDSTRRIGERLLQLAAETRSPAAEYNGNRLLGLAYTNLGDYPKSLEFFQKAQVFAQQRGDKSGLAYCLHNTSYTLFSQNRFAEAIEMEVKAMNLYTELRDSNRIAACYNEIGRIASRLERYDEAIAYLKRGLEINLASRQNTYYSYSRLGEMYSHVGKFDSSIHFQEQAIKAAAAIKNLRGIAIEKNNIAENLVKKGELTRAKKLFEESFAFFESKQEKNNAPLVLCNLADLELKSGNPMLALARTNRALEIVGDMKNYGTLEKIYDLRAKAFEGLGDFKSAFQAARQFETCRDSVHAAERSQQVAEVEARFRTSEQQSLIAQQNLQLERQQNRNRWLIAAALFALLAGAGIAYFLKEKRRRAELNLKLQASETDRLRELDRVKSAFFANISHEFRTPLTLLVGPLGEMERGTFRGDAKKYFSIMRRNASRLLQLVNQLLDLSRLESGKLQLEAAPADLHRLLAVVAASFESLAAQREIDFQIRVPAEPFLAKFDADKIEKIVSNLLSNAFKFTHEGGRVLFEVLENQTNGFTEIRVSDTGIGIAAEQLPQIFDRFYQVENSGSDIQSGSGIGLALTKELVELHGGQISVESLENSGTTFLLNFSFEKVAEAAKVAAVLNPSHVGEINSSDVPAAANSPKIFQKTDRQIVLVAEDNADVRNYIVENLNQKFQIIQAADGEKALELAQNHTPDLILTDLMMPKLDGSELTRRLKNDLRTNHIPVVMLTAKSGRDQKIEGIETGAEAYLTKPFDAEELHATLRTLLAQRRILQEKFGKQIRLDAPAPAVVSLDEQFLQKVLAHIEENLDDENYGVENLAAAVAMSRSNLFRKLDALLAKSPNQLIRERRLLRAKSLLEQGAGNSTEVAFMTGFNSPSYFAKCFQEMFGEVPGAVVRRRAGA